MTPTQMILFVRGRSRLSFEEVMEIAEQRAPEFEAISGLTQKYYVEDSETGEMGGCYVWESAEALTDYQQSELRATIAAAYQLEGPPRVEVYRVAKTLRG